MNVSNLNIGPTTQFGQQNPLHAGRAQRKQRAPLDDALKRLTDNVIGAQTQRTEQQAEARKREIEMDTYVSELGGAENKDYEDMDTGLLKFFLNQFTNGARATQAYESTLTDFRDQLSAFDKTIQEYQDMLSGKAALPEQMTMETVTKLLDAAKSAREQFLNDGVKSMEDSRWIGSASSVYGHAKMSGRVSGEYADKDESFWRIDASADDIYAEIDRVLDAVRDLGKRFESGVSTISKELEKRGYTEDKYQDHFDKLRSFWSDVYTEWRADPNLVMRQYMEKALRQDEEE